jgi:hypothetical protein
LECGGLDTAFTNNGNFKGGVALRLPPHSKMLAQQQALTGVLSVKCLNLRIFQRRIFLSCLARIAINDVTKIAQPNFHG